MEETITEEQAGAATDVENQVDETVDAASSEQGHGAAAPDRVSQLESIIERLARQQAETLNALKASQAEKAKPKPLTKEELQQKWAESPVDVLEQVVESKLEKSRTQLQVESQKAYWDDKARSEFPTEDAKFRSAMEQAWVGLVEDGYDTSNPKALYRACKDAALMLGVKSKAAQSSSQAKPTGAESSAQPRQNPMRKSSISENDPRLVFYKAQFRPDAKKLQDFVKKLEADDQRRRR